MLDLLAFLKQNPPPETPGIDGVRVSIGGLSFRKEAINYLSSKPGPVKIAPPTGPSPFSEAVRKEWAGMNAKGPNRWRFPVGIALRCARHSMHDNATGAKIRRQVRPDVQIRPPRWILRWNDRVQANFQKLQAKLLPKEPVLA